MLKWISSFQVICTGKGGQDVGLNVVCQATDQVVGEMTTIHKLWFAKWFVWEIRQARIRRHVSQLDTKRL